jgi:hypothetical protein
VLCCAVLLCARVVWQVSAYGSDDSSDGGDVWIVDWDTTGKVWKQDTKVSETPIACPPAPPPSSVDAAPLCLPATPYRPTARSLCPYVDSPRQVKLLHRDTSAYLASNEQAKFGQPIHGQQEVCCMARSDSNTVWQTAEGVFMPTADAESGEDGSGDAAGSQEL